MELHHSSPTNRRLLRYARNDNDADGCGAVIARSSNDEAIICPSSLRGEELHGNTSRGSTYVRHCEERSDEAISQTLLLVAI